MSYIFINLNEKKCLKIQDDLLMKNSEYKVDIRSKSECQRRVVIILENVVDVCHNILRQRFKFFHELKDRAAAENLFKYACKKRNPLKRSIGSSNEEVIVAKKRPKHMYVRSDSEHQDTQAYTSDLSFEISKKQITDQVLNMELDLKKKKQDILNLRMDYFEEKESVDNQIKSLEKRVNCKEKQIDVAFPKLNGEIHELERRIIELKQEKREHLEELQSYNDNLEKNTKKKLGLKAKFLNHMKLEQSRVSEIKANLTKLKGAEVILNTKDTNIDNIEKFDRLSSQIEKYERKLECPVCLETCQQPIYQCLESQ